MTKSNLFFNGALLCAASLLITVATAHAEFPGAPTGGPTGTAGNGGVSNNKAGSDLDDRPTDATRPTARDSQYHKMHHRASGDSVNPNNPNTSSETIHNPSGTVPPAGALQPVPAETGARGAAGASK